jgi:ribosome-binding factor A
MAQGSRPDRVADQIRGELGSLLAREVHDPGIGFVTLTRVQVTPDLQTARVYYTALGDETARKNSARALERATPFLRRQIGSRLRLRRVPELTFIYDESIAGQDRIEQLLSELHGSTDQSARGPSEAPEGSARSAPPSESEREPSAKSAGGGAPAPGKMWGPASRDDDEQS